MPENIRIGLINTGWWAEMMYLPALQSHPHAETAAICGRDQGRAGEVAAKYHIPLVFSDYREMIQQGHLDAIIIAAPDEWHHRMTVDALQAGLHVLCEKPLGMNAREALDMLEKAQAAGVKHMTYFTYRWMPFFRFARDLIAQGFIGRCYHCDFRQLSGFGRGKDYEWRFDRNRANGALGDLGSHMIDLARWLIGDIATVTAQLGCFGSRQGIEGETTDPANDSALLMVEFSNGAHGLIQASAVAYLADRLMQQQVVLYGDEGSLEINIAFGGQEAGAVIRGVRSKEDEFQVLQVPAEYWGEVSSLDPFGVFNHQPIGVRFFIDAIIEDHPISPDFYDGYKAQQVIDAALQSHQTGCRVEIPT
jgi:predicted dehydrogenase